MKYICSLCLILAALGPPCLAQSQSQKSGTITSSQCVSIDVSVSSTVGIQVTGTWSGTLQPELSIQGQTPQNTQVTPSTSTTAQSTITANGLYRTSVAGGSTFLLCGNTVASGTANVYLNSTTASAGNGFSGGGGNSTAPTNTLPAAVNAINAYGDSITFGYGIPYIQANVVAGTTTSQNYVSLFASHFGLSISNNYAYFGGPRFYSQQFIGDAYANTASNSTMSITRFGGNEGGDFPAGIAQINLGVQAMLVWLSLPSSAIQLETSMTTTGTWSSGTLSFQTSKFSGVANSTITGTANGTTVYLAGSAESGFGTGEITIDGVDQGAFSFNNTTVTAPAEIPVCFRFSGLSPGNHSIQLKVNSGIVSIAWVAGNQNATQQPYTIVGAMLSHSGVSNTDIATFNSTISGTITNLVSDGLNLLFINDNPTVSPTALPAQFQPDHIHPNAFGDQLIAKQWIQIFQPALTFPQPAGKGGDFLAQVLQNSGSIQGSNITPADLAAFINGNVNFQSAGGLPWGWANLDGNANLAVTAFNTINSYSGIGVFANGVPTENAGQVDLTAQTAAITAHALYTPIISTTATGLYRVCWTADITTADTTSSTLGGSAGFTVTYTSPTDSVSKTSPSGVSGSTSTGNTTATAVGGCVMIKDKLNSAITFSFGYTAGTGNMAYEIHVAIEAL